VDDPKDLVRRGYDALSLHYDAAFQGETKYRRWLSDLSGELAESSRVADVGCGSGIPVARDLVKAGHHVTGIDISEVQIQRARELVPSAEFIHADATTVDFPAGSIDAVVAFYSFIHVPLDEQFLLLQRIASWLRPGGLFVATMGHREWTGTDDNWLGAGATMWWSHADIATTRSWLTQAGLVVESEEFVPEGDSGAVLLWARLAE